MRLHPFPCERMSSWDEAKPHVEKVENGEDFEEPDCESCESCDTSDFSVFGYSRGEPEPASLTLLYRNIYIYIYILAKCIIWYNEQQSMA